MVFDMIPNTEYRMGNNVVPFMMSVILIVFLHYKIYLKLLPEADSSQRQFSGCLIVMYMKLALLNSTIYDP